jgi:hypothetical protein
MDFLSEARHEIEWLNMVLGGSVVRSLGPAPAAFRAFLAKWTETICGITTAKWQSPVVSERYLKLLRARGSAPKRGRY